MYICYTHNPEAEYRPWKMVFGRRSSPFGVVDLFRAYLKLRGCAQYIICIGLGKGPTLLERVPHHQFQTATLGIQIMANDEYKEVNYLNKKCYSACNSAKTTSQLVLLFLAFWSCMCFFVVSNAKKLWTSRVEKQYAAPPTAISPHKTQLPDRNLSIFGWSKWPQST